MIILLTRNNFQWLVFAIEILCVLYAMVFLISKFEPILCCQDVLWFFNLCFKRSCVFKFVM